MYKKTQTPKISLDPSFFLNMVYSSCFFQLPFPKSLYFLIFIDVYFWWRDRGYEEACAKIKSRT